MIRLRITLVHPAELAKWIRTEYLHSMRAPSWSGLFKFGEHEERSPCSLSLDAVWSEKCVAKPKALQYAIIVCNPPKTLPCDSLVSLNGNRALYEQDFKTRLPSDRKKYLERPYYYTAITNVPSDIFVTDKSSGFPARDVVFNEMRSLVRDVFKGLGLMDQRSACRDLHTTLLERAKKLTPRMSALHRKGTPTQVPETEPNQILTPLHPNALSMGAPQRIQTGRYRGLHTQIPDPIR
eukprot:XP_011676182.1 PREDICTED: uncharacterized protein LOC105444087 [Strongylocentrotus purpuratus]